MKLRLRLGLLAMLLVLLPALPAAWVTRQLLVQSLDLGLSAEVEASLEAGVRQARRNFQLEREAFRRSAEEALGPHRSTGTSAEVESWLAAHPLPGVGIEVLPPAGASPSTPPTDAPPSMPPTGAAPDVPPTADVVRFPLADGGAVTFTRTVPPEWRDDAAALASSFQIVRGLQARREALENGFLVPFLLIYGVALALALVAAFWIGQGIVRPLERLTSAVRAVSFGNWKVQVHVRGRDEVAELGRGFNRMLGTLDAQSRQILDLEKMESWREMARALAHEVKNPLTPIQLTVEEMAGRYTGDDPKYRQLLDECSHIVVKEVESLRNIVTRFREFSRPVEPHFAEFDLAELVTEVGGLQRDLEVELDLAPGTGRILADPDRLRQVLMNLLRNAREATREAARPKVRLATRGTEAQVTILVEDNGPGIPEAERARVFEPYRTGRKEGLGLGLTLVKGIVIAHGGSIAIESGPWQGALFRIELPRRPEVPA